MSAAPPDMDDRVRHHLENAARLLGVPLDESWKPAIVVHLTALLAAADLVLDFPLDDRLEAAPVFAP